MDIEIDQRDLDALNKKMDDLEELNPIRIAIQQALIHLSGKAKEYPEATAANQAGPYPKRWYERGYGSRWARVDGSVGGNKTSETLGRKWTSKISGDGLTGTIGNNVSYGPYVMSEDKQASFHKARGWNTTTKIVENETPVIIKMFYDAIEKLING